MADFCMPPPEVRTACIYFLKNTHKNPMGIRPIVSPINSPTANVAKFPDIYLQSSLYTNIPNDQGIQACHEGWLNRETTNPQHSPAQVLRHLLELVLKLNTFEFDTKNYLQKFGTAMGSKLAPANANAFMGKLEKFILDSAPRKP